MDERMYTAYRNYMQDAGCKMQDAGLHSRLLLVSSLNVYTPHSTLSSVFSLQPHSHTSVSNGSLFSSV
jgi:hypothetical protein